MYTCGVGVGLSMPVPVTFILAVPSSSGGGRGGRRGEGARRNLQGERREGGKGGARTEKSAGCFSSCLHFFKKGNNVDGVIKRGTTLAEDVEAVVRILEWRAETCLRIRLTLVCS